MRVPVTRLEIFVSHTASGPVVHVPSSTTAASPVPAASPVRECPGAPGRRVRRRMEESESDDDIEEASEEASVPAARRQLDFEPEDEYTERVFCPIEMECRAAMNYALASPGAITNRAFCVLGAFTDFATTFPTSLPTGQEVSRVYMLEMPLRGITGFMKVRGSTAREIVVEQFGFLPWSANNLGILLEGINRALISQRGCFSGLESIYLVQPREPDLCCGLPGNRPDRESECSFLVDTYRCLKNQGFLAHTVFEGRDEYIDINVFCIGAYLGYKKTRLAALWRMVNH